MQEQKAPFPFNLIEAMMPGFPMIAVVGWLIVAASLVIGVSALSPAQAAFYSDAEAVREAAAAGSDFVRANVSAHIIETWVPQFKFLGLGLGLMAITLALTVIIGTLRMQAAVLLRFEDQVGGRGQPR